MPPGWRQDVRSVPGTTSADAFTYLHTLWYEKEEERKEEERDTKRVKALMAAHSNPTTPNLTQGNQPRSTSRSVITCHNCGKPGHITKKCWGKGRGMEGQWPKQGQVNKTKAGTSANAATPDDPPEVVSPMATYVMSAQASRKPNKMIPF
ncbi:hypothetical protein HHX47_DHR10000422 [Lentinula edodes]|nr:hypothetical protein HHX47_DHR10000422 [Lentinula edodes]